MRCRSVVQLDWAATLPLDKWVISSWETRLVPGIERSSRSDSIIIGNPSQSACCWDAHFQLDHNGEKRWNRHGEQLKHHWWLPVVLGDQPWTMAGQPCRVDRDAQCRNHHTRWSIMKGQP